MKSTLALVLFFACCGSSFAGNVQEIAVPSQASKAVREVVGTAWPKVLKACPGISKFASDLEFAGVEDNLSYAPKNAQRIDVKFRIGDSPAKIPNDYRAFGQTCYFSISPDGKKLNIGKQPCASVCLDREQSKGDMTKELQ